MYVKKKTFRFENAFLFKKLLVLSSCLFIILWLTSNDFSTFIIRDKIKHCKKECKIGWTVVKNLKR